MLLMQHNSQRGSINADDIREAGGGSSIAHMKATLIALPHSIGNQEPANAVHVRPLYTAGDLMLALFELMDSQLFQSGCIQMFGLLPSKDSNFSTEVNIFRCVMNPKKNNRWYYLRPK
jgi:hypothetical protein